MKLFFSKKQYQQLFKAIAVARWIAEVGTDYGAEGKEFKDYYTEIKEIADYIESFAGDMQMLKFVDDESDEYDQFMKDISDIMHEYEESIFYDKLVDKLCVRDCVKKYGNAFFDMDPVESMKKRLEFARKYEDEIYENGVKRLEIVRSGN
ncbi:MAG TPA: hypothetical protein PK926_16775 [Spirochaetota bacterium]|nr:hypothetical protein [Spirochaetota bacterium]HPI90729.1 hypothetical protein [Spirochaetota bacterium]HPR49750.1 hypothetical protein [Spirochaetota bacterium]